MPILMVVDNTANWPLSVPGVEVVSSRKYLTDPEYSNLKNLRIFNLCRSYRYKSYGYYVSLLAEARGHKPQPDIRAIHDMKSGSLTRVLTDDLDELIQRTLKPIRAQDFELSIYFGRTTAKRDEALGRRLFGSFRCPLLRVQFKWRQKWHVSSIRPVPASEIADSHRPIVIEAAEAYFGKRNFDGPTSQLAQYDLAILVDPSEQEAPSDEAALQRFVRAARRHNVATDFITKDDFGHLGEFDALFIRTTTALDHYTYRFSRRAAADGMAVIDDPQSIARCTNKVYLAERLASHDVPIPKTVVVHKGNVETIIPQLGLPVVLKQPDSAFSRGVIKAATEEEFKRFADELLDDSDLIVAQSFMPTEFDWRVGVLDGQALYVCKYYMAQKHWQILKRGPSGRSRYGKTETFPIGEAPRRVITTALKAAKLIGDGLYGVDLKQVGNRVYVMEVNDNPNIDAGTEDAILKEELYDRVIESFIRRIERIRRGLQKGIRNGRAQTV